MRQCRTLTMCLAFSISFSLAFVPHPVSAFSLSVGDYWTYQATWDMGTYELTGTTTYAIEDRDSITIDGEAHDVYVYRISGSLTGSRDVLGIDTSVETVTSGVMYDVADGFATVKSDVTYWMNYTGTLGSIQIAVRTQIQNIVTYSPPLMDGFDPDSVGPSDLWNETIVETWTEVVQENGVETSRETDFGITVYRFEVDASEVAVRTAAGEFETLRITITDGEDHREVMYWSTKVGGYVKYEAYDPDETEPFIVEELAEYEHSSGLGVLAIVLIGAIAAAVAVAVLLMVVLRVRRPRVPQQYMPPREAPSQPPTSPGPPPSP